MEGSVGPWTVWDQWALSGWEALLALLPALDLMQEHAKCRSANYPLGTRCQSRKGPRGGIKSGSWPPAAEREVGEEVRAVMTGKVGKLQRRLNASP